MRTEQKREKLVSNRTDSSLSVDERQIKESRGRWQRSLPLPDLSRKIEGPLLAGYTFVKHTKSPASWDPGIAMPGSRLAGVKIYHVIAIAGPARLAGLTLSRQ